MTLSARFQVLICLMVYASSAHAIMVKFGTKGGPIVPPVLVPELPPQQPYRIPAPVWEERSNDTPDPNAQWRPPHFVPQPRYTNVYSAPAPAPIPLNNVQRFVNSYIPQKPTQHPQGFFPPTFLSSQSVPGVGIRYFVPAFINEPRKKEHPSRENEKVNTIEDNTLSVTGEDSASDFQWKYEKEAIRRVTRTSQEATGIPVYQFPVYVPARHR